MCVSLRFLEAAHTAGHRGAALRVQNVVQPVSHCIRGHRLCAYLDGQKGAALSITSTTGAASARVLLFGARRLPHALRALPTDRPDGAEGLRALVDGLPDGTRRLIVVGGDDDLGQVLTRLMRAEKLDVELGFVPDRRSRARRIYRIRFGSARRARDGSAHRVPLIRDDTGTALAGRASWQTVIGEATVDDTLLFGPSDGAATVDVEPTESVPGLRASVRRRPRLLPRHWATGRAVQLGTEGAVVVRDGVAGPRPVTRSTFYRHQQGWLLVR